MEVISCKKRFFIINNNLQEGSYEKTKKIIGLLTLLGVLSSPVTANAGTIYSHNEWNSKGFDKAWESTVSDIGYTFNYGYNTTWINEDYSHSIHDSYDHTAALSNSNGGFESSIKGAGKWAKIEVRHSGTKVLYGIRYGYF